MGGSIAIPPLPGTHCCSLRQLEEELQCGVFEKLLRVFFLMVSVIKGYRLSMSLILFRMVKRTL